METLLLGKTDVVPSGRASTVPRANYYQPDFDALRKASTCVVIAAGAESEGEMAHRAAVAERRGTAPVTFPSGHGGLLGGECGQTGAPEAFASKLREVLTAKA